MQNENAKSKTCHLETRQFKNKSHTDEFAGSEAVIMLLH